MTNEPRGLFDPRQQRWLSPEEVAGVPVEFRDKTFDDVEPRDNPTNFNEVLAGVKTFVERLEEALQKGEGLVLCGTVGTGKTLLASLVAIDAIRLAGCKNVLQVEAHQLFDSLKPDSGKQASKGYYNRAVAKPKDQYNSVALLVVDDIGAEYQTDWAQVELDHIITTRHNKRLSTCITTNLLNADEFEETYGPRIADRLLERNTWYTLNGPSYRGSRK